MAKSKPNLINTTNTNKTQGKNTNKLLNFFRIAPTENGKIIPTEPEKDKNGKETDKYRPIEMPSTLENAYQYLISNLSTAPYMDNAFRFERYKDVKYMVETEPLINMATNVYVSETYNVQNGKKPLEIHAKDKKVEKLFYEWIDEIGFSDSFIKNAIYNLVIYGDAFWINNIDMKSNLGITEITALDPFLIADRIEFNVGVINQKKSWYQPMLNLVNSYDSIKNIFDIVKGNNLEDISQFYKSYLFGYTLKLSAEEEETQNSVKGVPPWSITHCKLFTTDSAYFPFGKPMMLSALPSYKSYKTTQMLIDMLRCASFPREHITIKGEDNMNPFTRSKRVDEVRRFLENVTPKTNNQDGLSVGSRIYDMEGLCDFDIIDPSVDLDQLGDLEYKQTSMIWSTGIPDSYLLPSEGAGDLGGENAESLRYLNKIFQRRCDSLRESILEGITQTFRMHLMLTNQFDGDKTEFELSIKNNVEDFTDDEISKISDTFDLAKDIIDAISSCAGLERGETVDQSVLKDILRQYLPVEASTIEDWISKIYKSAEEEKENETDEDEQVGDMVMGKKGNFFERKRIIETNIKNALESGKIDEEYFSYKRKHNLVEGNVGNKYYYNNTYRLKKHYDGTVLSMLNEQLQTNKVNRLKEQEQEK